MSLKKCCLRIIIVVNRLRIAAQPGLFSSDPPI
jgi:hypothetical protein